jgi:hypothetical protein
MTAWHPVGALAGLLLIVRQGGALRTGMKAGLGLMGEPSGGFPQQKRTKNAHGKIEEVKNCLEKSRGKTRFMKRV